MTSAVRTVIGLSITILFVLSYLSGSLALTSSALQFASTPRETIVLPDASILRVVSLNSTTFAGDVAWAAAVVDHGEAKRNGRLSDAIGHNAAVIADIDPGFLRIYEWYPAAYLNNLAKVDSADVDRVNDFIKAGMVIHPLDFSLPYSAALNYIGYSNGLTREKRLDQVNDAIRLLEGSVALSGADESVPLLLTWFYSRKRQLLNNVDDSKHAKDAEIAFNLKLLSQTTDSDIRIVAQQNLRLLGVDDLAVLQAVNGQQRSLDLALLRSQPYLPLDFWLTLQEERLQ
jgi:hypothetical protein